MTVTRVASIRLAAGMAAAGLLLWAPSALARTTQSTNWAGYAIHHSGQSFHQVVGVWQEPSATCRRGRRTFSSYWVGLGGYSSDSPALEQTGTEVDCTSQGQVRAFAWFELVPAPSLRIRLRVPPGDLIQGAVAVTGRRVRITLQDLTRHTKFSKVLRPHQIDTSSAEWIVEAPSECLGGGRCATLPLANFGSARFGGAMVEPRTGKVGSISDPRWRTTRIRLVPDDQHFVATHPGLGAGGRAAPSALTSGGSAFTVNYARLAGHPTADTASAGPATPIGPLRHGAS